jgi:hypothetical protein
MSTVFQAGCYIAFTAAGAGTALKLPWWACVFMGLAGHFCYHASIVLSKEKLK